MRHAVIKTMAALLLAGGATLLTACSKATAEVGPNGGDVVAVPNTSVKAEVIGNADTGEVVVRTWDGELKEPEPLAEEPLVLGEGDRRLELMPHAMADDPEGRSSRFYGRAEWLRGGSVDRAWIECCGSERGREQFGWSHGWEAGRSHGDMWREMRAHGEGMREHGMGMPPGAAAPPADSPEQEHGMEHMPAGPMGVPPAEPPATPPQPKQEGGT